MFLRERIQTSFLEELLATPEGRAHVLNTAGDAENADEARIFELLLERVDDPELVQLIRRHQEDEVRHAAMFFDCVRRQGVEPYPVPPEQQIITRLAELTGEIDVSDRLGVMRAYVLLQVIEERAVTQFAVMEPVLRRFDAASADVMRAIARDEQRHLKYCHAIARRYAPDERTHARTLAHYRAIEARAFAANSRSHMQYVLDRGLVGRKPLARLVWRGLAALSARHVDEERTPFWGLPPGQTRSLSAA
jgi:rubrerythrin